MSEVKTEILSQHPYADFEEKCKQLFLSRFSRFLAVFYQKKQVPYRIFVQYTLIK